MRRGQIGSALLVVVVALLVLRPWEDEGAEAAPASTDATVARVVDGDTVEIEFGEAREDLRLIGVDTPETVKPGEPVQCFGPQASAFTHRRLEGRSVRVDFGVERRDIYGRLLGYVKLDGEMFNATLVRRGFARSLTIPPNDRYAGLFHRLELNAARTGRGLWGTCSP